MIICILFITGGIPRPTYTKKTEVISNESDHFNSLAASREVFCDFH